MSETEIHTQALIQDQTATNVPTAQRGSSSRAGKVAGLTLLASVLIVGQAVTAYFLITQRGDITTQAQQIRSLKTEMRKTRFDTASMQKYIPMNVMPRMTDSIVDELASPGAQPKTGPPQATDCQLEAAGKKPVQVPGFLPDCDERGLYQVRQCFKSRCWSVNPVNGQMIPGSTTGQAPKPAINVNFERGKLAYDDTDG